MKRRVTASVTLVLIGSAALQGCGDDTNVTARDLYRTRGDCQRDWGDDATRCEPVTSGPHSGYYYGPHYQGRTTNGTARSGSHAVSTHVSRGGFGASASAHGASS